MAQNSWVKCNNSVAKIAPCSCHLVLKQCSSFSQSIYHYLLEQCSNRLFKQIQSVSKSEILYRISHGNLCHLIEAYTKHIQTKIEFVQTTGQAVKHTSRAHWLKFEHCLSTSSRLHAWSNIACKCVMYWYATLWPWKQLLNSKKHHITVFCPSLPMYQDGLFVDFNFQSSG